MIPVTADLCDAVSQPVRSKDIIISSKSNIFLIGIHLSPAIIAFCDKSMIIKVLIPSITLQEISLNVCKEQHLKNPFWTLQRPTTTNGKKRNTPVKRCYLAIEELLHPDSYTFRINGLDGTYVIQALQSCDYLT
jgi:hypothetical protein